MGPRIVVDRILHELERRQAYVIEIQVVGAADALDRERRCAQRGKRLQPRFEDRADRFVPLQENAADLAGAVVEVEVARQLAMAMNGLGALTLPPRSECHKGAACCG